MIRVGINGFGRIGRCVFRIIEARDDMEVVALNDVGNRAQLAYLLQYDTVMGRFPGDVRYDGDARELILTDREGATRHCRMLSERDPAKLPWSELGVDVAIESTGVFRQRAQVALHLQAGAHKAILTVPPKDEVDKIVVLGVNDGELEASHDIVSNASCTTNCLAPLAKILHHQLGGIHKGYMTTIHAFTNDQRLAASPHPDFRRSRAAAQNIIPTTTGAARAVGKVLPELDGKLDGLALRVPIPDGSVIQLTTEMDAVVTAEQVRETIARCAEGPLAGILQYSEAPLVSSDIVGNPHSCIFDANYTQVTNKRILNTVAWYDNEWGYSNRVCDLAKRLMEIG